MTAFVQIDAWQFWKSVSETEADKNPIFQRGTQLLLALPEVLAKSNHPRQLRNLSGETAIFKLVEVSQLHRSFDIGGERKRHIAAS